MDPFFNMYNTGDNFSMAYAPWQMVSWLDYGLVKYSYRGSYKTNLVCMTVYSLS